MCVYNSTHCHGNDFDLYCPLGTFSHDKYDQWAVVLGSPSAHHETVMKIALWSYMQNWKEDTCYIQSNRFASF